MDITIRKLYWDYEKEEEWLNAMAERGLVLKSYTCCKYVFEKCERGEYIHRIELLENKVSHPKSMEYIEFMRETGAEYVSAYMRWVYFRKKTADGRFDIYSDIDSKITHYKRVIMLFTPVMILNLFPVISNFISAISLARSNGYGTVSIFLLSSLNLLLACVLGSVIVKYRHKIKYLANEKVLRE